MLYKIIALISEHWFCRRNTTPRDTRFKLKVRVVVLGMTAFFLSIPKDILTVILPIDDPFIVSIPFSS